MMVHSKLKSEATTQTAAIETVARSMTLDDFDPLNRDVQRKPTIKPTWARIRLAILLSILFPLALFGFLHNRQTTLRTRIEKALDAWDNRRALKEIRKFEERFGSNAETAFLQSRAYRHLGDDSAFDQFSEVAQQLGYPEEKIRNERLLRDLYVGNVDNMRESMAVAIASPGAELEEVGPAIVYGLLHKLDFGGIEQFLVFWTQEEPGSPWIPFFRGMKLLAGQKISAAIESFEKCAKRHPEFVPVYGQLGAAYLRVSKNEKGIATLKRYLQSVPGDTFAAISLATALANDNRNDEVIELLAPLVESGSANPEMRMLLAREYLEREEWSNVVDALSSVAATWPEDVRTAGYLSQAHQALGNEQEAVRFAKVVHDGQAEVDSIDDRISKILSGEDSSAEKHYELGHILLHKQSREDGLYWLSSAIALDPSYLPAHEDLAIYFHRTKQSKLAARHQRYIELRRQSH